MIVSCNGMLFSCTCTAARFSHCHSAVRARTAGVHGRAQRNMRAGRGTSYPQEPRSQPQPTTLTALVPHVLKNVRDGVSQHSVGRGTKRKAPRPGEKTIQHTPETSFEEAPTARGDASRMLTHWPAFHQRRHPLAGSSICKLWADASCLVHVDRWLHFLLGPRLWRAVKGGAVGGGGVIEEGLVGLAGGVELAALLQRQLLGQRRIVADQATVAEPGAPDEEQEAAGRAVRLVENVDGCEHELGHHEREVELLHGERPVGAAGVVANAQVVPHHALVVVVPHAAQEHCPRDGDAHDERRDCGEEEGSSEDNGAPAVELEILEGLARPDQHDGERAGRPTLALALAAPAARAEEGAKDEDSRRDQLEQIHHRDEEQRVLQEVVVPKVSLLRNGAAEQREDDAGAAVYNLVGRLDERAEDD
mmetsp:Transcript_29518/g.95218  ORF Transcript_29518/g.95218 Transcript_29518/m.95218 type:complete len:419 (+) Transcript_29518:86-1342(+)